MNLLAPLVAAASLAGAPGIASAPAPEDSPCEAAFTLKPEAVEIDEGRWKRLCRAGLSPEDIPVRSEEAKPCLPYAEKAPAGPEREEALDICWGLIEAPGAAPEGPAAKAPQQPPPAVGASPALDAKKKVISQAVASGDVSQLYGEQAMPVETVMVEAVSPAAGGSEGGSGPPGTVSFSIVLSPDGGVVPDPKLGKEPDEVPPCGTVRTPPKGGDNAKLYARLEAGAACLPWVGRPMLHYLKVLGLRSYDHSDSLGAKNQGLDRFYESLGLKDPVFKEQVRAFYKAVREHEKGVPTPVKPHLDDKTGTGTLAPLKPGWAWDAALKASGGDPNRAMRLVGFCGHDDVLQSRLLTKRTPEQALKAMEDGRAAMLKEVGQIEATLKAAGQPLDFDDEKDPMLMGPFVPAGAENPSQLRYQRSKLLKTLGSLSPAGYAVKSEDVCPGSNSPFYAPGSLGAETVLPKDLQTRIAAAQAPKDGPSSLPAKYYHTLGAAATACELVRKGAPGWFAKLVQSNAAWAYRSLRLDERAQQSLQARESYKAEFKTASESGKVSKGLSFEAFVAQKHTQAAGGDALPGEETAAALTRKRVELTYIDAFTLMESRGYGGYKVFGQRIPFSDTSLRAPWNWFRSGVPKGWSKERTAAAEARLKTFLVDSEWTVEQHRLGAAFAAERCKPEEAAALKKS